MLFQDAVIGALFCYLNVRNRLCGNTGKVNLREFYHREQPICKFHSRVQEII